ncbi:cobalamin B12-binding domain-containing protein [Streptomyces sp. NBC_00370]
MTREDQDRRPGQAGVTTGSVARRLGVSPTTLRSWDRRYGIGPAVRESGSHRRWMPRDIAVLEEMCRLTSSGVPPAEAARAVSAEPSAHQETEVATAVRSVVRSGRSGSGLPLGDVRHECRGLARAARRLDAPLVEDLLTSFLDQHGLIATWDEMMAPTLRAVGRKWESHGGRYVEVEHLLSWHISSVLRRLQAPAPPAADAVPALLACVHGDQHTLPLEAVAAGMAQLCLPARVLGGSVPAEALSEAVRRIGPAAVVLWSQSHSTADRPLALRIAATGWGVKGARTRTAVLLAGPGWGGTSVPGLLRPHSLREALDMLAEFGARGGPVTPALR